MSREVLQQALQHVESNSFGGSDTLELIAALREALAQPEQEPVAWQLTFRDEFDNPRREVLHSKQHLISHVEHNTINRNLVCSVTPLYTSPPQRQPLTDGEIKQIELGLRQYNSRDTYDLSLNEFARAIEAKLKEKNI